MIDIERAGNVYMMVEYSAPEKKITSEADAHAFANSGSGGVLNDYVANLANAVVGVPCDRTDRKRASTNVVKICELLEELDQWVEDFPPLSQPMRFGNKAYRQWSDRLDERTEPRLAEILPTEMHPAIVELSPYFRDSFGNRLRIDYGTGHELHFLAFLAGLEAIGFLTKEDRRDVVIIIFKEYTHVMRLLLVRYVMEPAGSRGAWGLDDFHFLPFLFGAHQLMENPELILPGDVFKVDIMKSYADKYLYLDAINFISQVKTGATLGECAPLLNDITAVPNWMKVSKGLKKMYVADVLSRYPVVQHFLFGSLFPYSPSPTE